jgi:hypothetical protein
MKDWEHQQWAKAWRPTYERDTYPYRAVINKTYKRTLLERLKQLRSKQKPGM